MKNATVIFLILMFTTANAYATCYPKYCKGKGAEVIDKVFLHNAGGDIWLIAPPADRDQLNCTLHNGNSMVLQQDHPLFKEIYSTLLTGLAADKTLTVRIAEGSSNCRVAYIQMASD